MKSILLLFFLFSFPSYGIENYDQYTSTAPDSLELNSPDQAAGVHIQVPGEENCSHCNKDGKGFGLFNSTTYQPGTGSNDASSEGNK